MATIAEAFAIAVQHHQAGRLDLAEASCRQILAVQPGHADALHLLGVIAHQVGQPAVAAEYIRQAIASNGNVAAYHNNLGEAYRATGRIADAVACYRRALELNPNLAETRYNLGAALQAAGELDDAIACYRCAVQLKPNYAEAYHNLGVTLSAQGRAADAIACFRQALAFNPDLAEAHYNLGTVLQDQKKPAEAIACYRRALQLNPQDFQSCKSRGDACQQLQQWDEAAACYRRALAIEPDDCEAFNNLGNALQELGQWDEAVACYRRALQLRPDYAEAHNNLGITYRNQGKLPDAIDCYRRALELRPDFAQAHTNLGAAWQEWDRPAEALACYRRAIELKPDYPQAYYNLGALWDDQEKLDDAVACYQRALQLKPDFAEAHFTLGNALRDQGRMDEAVACYRRALELKPNYVDADHNLVYAINFLPNNDPQQILAEHQRWNRQHAQGLAKPSPSFSNDRSPDRRLRIGYVSPDFRHHPVGRFLLPLLEAHDHANFEIVCYASVRKPDAITQLCRTHADVWQDVRGRTDAELADHIRRDQIDILVDLAMHMRDNRLLVFARKPAPVQATYLAYCGTTGLETIDYRLTDPYLDPPGGDESIYSEQSIRLPDTYWCYRPMVEAPQPGPLPAHPSGEVTFGCLNNFCKTSGPALSAWGRLLQALPTARLILHARPGSHRDRVRTFLVQRGVTSDRLTFVDYLPAESYFRTYQRIDIALDPFPYGGGTTTCDALWMGVPVVSLAGQTAVGRAGLSILSNVGLPEFVAADPEQYVKIAVALAQDLPHLSQLRGTLRQRLQTSPLMDAARFARNVEAAYRAMWRRWCLEGSS